jgi:prepilin-type N-terminal cleavage/methylation domain-containing protein
MQKRKSSEKGFTLIEVIVTLVLVGITSALAGMWIVSVVNGYMFAKNNAATLQKGQLAITRLEKEFVAMKSVTSGSGTIIGFTRPDSNLGSDITVTVTQVGTALQLAVSAGGWGGPYTLTDKVSAFNLNYCDDTLPTPNCSTTWTSASAQSLRVIVITLTLTGADNTPSTFTRRVALRNM